MSGKQIIYLTVGTMSTKSNMKYIIDTCSFPAIKNKKFNHHKTFTNRMLKWHLRGNTSIKKNSTYCTITHIHLIFIFLILILNGFRNFWLMKNYKEKNSTTE